MLTPLLTLLATAAHCADANALKVVAGGWYDTQLPVPVMHLEGGIEDVARSHGALLALDAKAGKNGGESTIHHLSQIASETLGSGPVSWLYHFFIRKPLIDHVPERYQAAYAGFAQAAGISESEVYDALVLPDAALRLFSLLYRVEPTPRLPNSFGCTSVIWNSGTTSALHGRNLDYSSVGYWDKNPLIMHIIPQDGLAHVSITAAGIHAPGITAFNEAGLTLAVHELTLDDTQASGTPMPIISAEIMRNARTIDDAIAIIRGFPRSGGWAYVLSRGRDRAVIETSASEIAIRRSSEPFFFQTNHVSSPALASHELFYTPGSRLDSFERAARLSKMGQAENASRTHSTPERLVAMLSDYGGTKPRVVGGTIAKLDNIQSVVMDASHRRLWVAVGDESHAPNEKTFIEYRWSDLRSADPPELTGGEFTQSPETKLGANGAKLRALLRLAIQNKPQYLTDYARLVEALTKDELPPSGTWGGLFLEVWESLSQTDKPVDLEALLKRVELALRDPDLKDTTRVLSQHYLSVGRLTHAYLLDLLGRRGEALYDYYVIRRSAPFARVQLAAARGLKTAYSWKRAQTLAIDWSGVDLFDY